MEPASGGDAEEMEADIVLVSTGMLPPPATLFAGMGNPRIVCNGGKGYHQSFHLHLVGFRHGQRATCLTFESCDFFLGQEKSGARFSWYLNVDSEEFLSMPGSEIPRNIVMVVFHSMSVIYRSHGQPNKSILKNHKESLDQDFQGKSFAGQWQQFYVTAVRLGMEHHRCSSSSKLASQAVLLQFGLSANPAGAWAASTEG